MLVIGIAGGTGSGKSTITRLLKEKFGDAVTVIYHDNYYRAQNEKTMEERATTNYDAPEAFETELLVEHLKQLREGRTILCPTYDYTVHNRAEEVIEIAPTEVILLDGILVLADPRLREQMDVKIFVDTDADVRVLRRIRRDMLKRGRTLESVIDQYLTTVKPMHEMYVEPSRKYADIIVPQGGHNLIAMQMLECHVLNFLKDEAGKEENK